MIRSREAGTSSRVAGREATLRRRQLVDLEDLPWWPRVLRDATTDYLATALRSTRMYAVLVPRLASALRRTGANRITDLCSGGGGPWADLLPALRAEGVDVSLCLTDKYPNIEALAKVAGTVPEVSHEPRSVDATDVPAHLIGFRTMFTAFHHFRPSEARAILAAAVRDGQGIAISEATSRTPAALALMPIVPLAVWLMTPSIRPFRWSRLFWTYLVPVLPVVILFDGIVSCLRIYTPGEMEEMAREVGGEAYDWESGVEHPSGSPIPIPYLIGVPRRPAGEAG